MTYCPACGVRNGHYYTCPTLEHVTTVKPFDPNEERAVPLPCRHDFEFVGHPGVFCFWIGDLKCKKCGERGWA